MVISCHIGLGMNLGPLQEQPVLLTVGPSLHYINLIFYDRKNDKQLSVISVNISCM